MNVSVKDLLDDLNHEEARQYIGGVIFVTVVMVIGIVGNLHVLLVYTFHIRPSNHRNFILVLGILDFITCTVGMPFIILDLRNPLTFTMALACKILRFVNYFICSASSLILVVIAADRYRKICVPHGRQITPRVAILLCFLVLTVALFMSWPAPVLFGITTVQTSDPNINGSRCYTENRKNFQKYQGFFNSGLILIFGSSFCILVVLYTLIWQAIKKQARLKFENDGTNSGASSSSANVQTTADIVGTNDVIEMNSGKSSESNQETSSEAEKSVSCRDLVQRTGKLGGAYFDRKKKTTAMFLLLTSVYFVSYIPHLVLKIVTYMNKDFLLGLSFVEKMVYNTFIWCFFINNMANCFVYGCFDVRFRRELSRIYSRIFCRN